MKVLSYGETYQVCCPFCGDTRYRLDINYQWGVPDPKTDSNNLFLAKCYNEDCLADQGNRERLKNILKPYVRRATNKQITIAPGYDRPQRGIHPPGPMARLDQLEPDHHVRRFLSQRGHDATLLGQQFGLGYCLESRMKFADKRLIFPVYLDGALKGWQSRYVDENANGDVKDLIQCDDCKFIWRIDPPSGGTKVNVCPNCGSVGNSIRKVPKYFCCPGMSKSRCMMNYDIARKWPFGVIVEGPMDVCRVGTPSGSDRAGPSVCIFGHTMSDAQKQMAREAWGNGGLFLLLDPDANTDQLRLLHEMDGHFKYVVPVNLPYNRDPGDCEHSLIWELIKTAAKLKGVSF